MPKATEIALLSFSRDLASDNMKSSLLLLSRSTSSSNLSLLCDLGAPFFPCVLDGIRMLERWELFPSSDPLFMGQWLISLPFLLICVTSIAAPSPQSLCVGCLFSAMVSAQQLKMSLLKALYLLADDSLLLSLTNPLCFLPFLLSSPVLVLSLPALGPAWWLEPPCMDGMLQLLLKALLSGLLCLPWGQCRQQLMLLSLPSQCPRT